jgi:hypothetical protein
MKVLHVVGESTVCMRVCFQILPSQSTITGVDGNSSLWFEWQIITRKRSYRWSIWVRATDWRLHSDSLLIFSQLYSGCRFSVLFTIITAFIRFNVIPPNAPIDCQVCNTPFFSLQHTHRPLQTSLSLQAWLVNLVMMFVHSLLAFHS